MTKAKPISIRTCEQCGTPFKSSRRVQRFCSDRCRIRYHNNEVKSVVREHRANHRKRA